VVGVLPRGKRSLRVAGRESRRARPTTELCGSDTWLSATENLGELLFEQVGAEDAPVETLEVGQLLLLGCVEVPRILQERPSAVFERATGGSVVGCSSLIAANRVDRVGREALNVEPVEDQLGLRRMRGDGRAVGRREVHRHVSQLPRALRAQHLEELGQRVGGLALADPNDALTNVVDDDGDVVVMPSERELVHPDDSQVVEASRVELLADDARDDGADGPPVDARQLAHRRLAHLLGEVGDQLFQASREARLRSRPGNRFDMDATRRTVDSTWRVAQQRHRLAERQVAPEARLTRLVDGARLPARRATRATPTRSHIEHQLFPFEPDAVDAHRDDAQQTPEYGGDAHGRPSFGDESRNPEPTETARARPSLTPLRVHRLHPHEVPESPKYSHQSLEVRSLLLPI